MGVAPRSHFANLLISSSKHRPSVPIADDPVPRAGLLGTKEVHTSPYPFWKLIPGSKSYFNYIIKVVLKLLNIRGKMCSFPLNKN